MERKDEMSGVESVQAKRWVTILREELADSRHRQTQWSRQALGSNDIGTPGEITESLTFQGYLRWAKEHVVRLNRENGVPGVFLNGWKYLLVKLTWIAIQFFQILRNKIIHFVYRPTRRKETTRHDVIVFPIIDWHFRFQRPQQLAMQFARNGHRVFYLRTSFHGGIVPYITDIDQNVYEIHLPGKPSINIYQSKNSPRIEKAVCNIFRKMRGEFAMEDAVCLVDLPYWGSLAFQLRKQFGWKVIYDCMDYHSGFSSNTEHMLKSEESLCRDSDLMLVSSKWLYNRYSHWNRKTYLVPNAADFLHFHRCVEVIPKEMEGMSRPIVGYYGAISDWFDSQLVHDLAKLRPDWSFVLIGDTYGADIQPLTSCKNIHLLGEKPYQTLPAYLSGFDIGIIPFQKTPLTDATNPVKMFEMLSAGKPIVAADLEELRNYREYLLLASDREEWRNSIETALKDNLPERAQSRVDFARHHTWEKRHEQIEGLIQELYPRVSVIVVTYNNLNVTRLCLESIWSETGYPNYEVIIIDNHSTDGTVLYLEEQQSRRKNMKVIWNNSNEGFARANNQGIGIASGEYIIFLNNDTIVSWGWIRRLIKHLEDPSIGMAGPVTNFCGNEAEIDVDYRSIDQIQGFAQRYHRIHNKPKTFDINVLAMYCLAMRKSVVDEIGLLDEGFGIGMFEDDDYAHRVKQKGYRVVCAEDVFIHHFGEASFGKLKRTGEYMELFEVNKKRFENKWNTTWNPHARR